MVLKRSEVCDLIGFGSWTAVMGWLTEVVKEARMDLFNYLRPYDQVDQRCPLGNERIKARFVVRAGLLESIVRARVAELEAGYGYHLLDKPSEGAGLEEHYEHFIIEAVAADRIDLEKGGSYEYHIADQDWSKNPRELFARMYELTEAICYNYFKTAETEMWDSEDSDDPHTNEDDVPVWVNASRLVAGGTDGGSP
ncbi:hypothetical protein VTK56DRAFT_2874 [Thermocarpiscus australiensis]